MGTWISCYNITASSCI